MSIFTRAAIAMVLGCAGLIGTRSLPAGASTGLTFFVNASSDGSSVSDCTTPSNVDCGIDNAIAAFDTDTTQNDADTIVFGSSSPIFVSNGTAINNTTTGVTLDVTGNGISTTAVSGADLNTVFTVNVGTVTISDLTIENGSATGVGGGGIFNSGTLAVMSDSFSNNSAAYNSGGGAIYNTGALSATDDTISNNSTTFANGAGIVNYGAATSTNDTFDDNTTAGGDGGGLFNYVGATFTATNDTLVGNSASGGGGAVFNYDGTLTASDDTFADDSAALGGGIMNYGTALVANSIISNAECYQSVTDGGYNVESDDSCGLGASDAVNSASINLAGSLAANDSSGPKTIAVGQDSSAYEEVPAIDCTVATDERGEPRPSVLGQNACDVGAFEFQHAAAVVHASQSIDFAPFGSLTLTSTPVILSATATSGLDVGFASSTTSVCAVSGATLDMLSVGTCSITARQNGDGYFYPAPSITDTFSVIEAPPVLPGRPTIKVSSPFKGRLRISIGTPASGATSCQYFVDGKAWARLVGHVPVTLSGLAATAVSVRVRGLNVAGTGPVSQDVRLSGARVVAASKQRRRDRYVNNATDFSKHPTGATDCADVVRRELHRRVVRRRRRNTQTESRNKGEEHEPPVRPETAWGDGEHEETEGDRREADDHRQPITSPAERQGCYGRDDYHPDPPRRRDRACLRKRKVIAIFGVERSQYREAEYC